MVYGYDHLKILLQLFWREIINETFLHGTILQLLYGENPFDNNPAALPIQLYKALSSFSPSQTSKIKGYSAYFTIWLLILLKLSNLGFLCYRAVPDKKEVRSRKDTVDLGAAQNKMWKARVEMGKDRDQHSMKEHRSLLRGRRSWSVTL